MRLYTGYQTCLDMTGQGKVAEFVIVYIMPEALAHCREGILPSDFQTTVIPSNAEVFATGSVKGNNNSRTLIVIPGPGARTVTYSATTTVAQLVSNENLHGRDIILDGQGILPAQWATTLLGNAQEIFATGSVKGNLA